MKNSYWTLDENGRPYFIDYEETRETSLETIVNLDKEINEFLTNYKKINEEEIEKMNKFFNE
jgi:hypothetical protein